MPGVSSTIPIGFAIAVWPGQAAIWMLEQLELLELFLGRCRKKVSASKRFTIHRASNVLTISLKRFGSCSSSGGRKITKVSAQ